MKWKRTLVKESLFWDDDEEDYDEEEMSEDGMKVKVIKVKGGDMRSIMDEMLGHGGPKMDY